MTRFTVWLFALFLSSASYAQTSLLTVDHEGNEVVTAEARELGFRTAGELRSYFQISEVTVTEDLRELSSFELAMTGFQIQNGTANAAVPAPPSTNTPGGSIADILTNLSTDFGDVKKWITLGTKLWELIKNNQPVVNVTTQTVSVLPQALPDWRQMETWKGPQAKSYTIAAKNLYGVTVVSHTYTVAFHYGGSYQGHGQFLANATIIPSNVDVSWGFSLASKVKVGEPLNTGTTQNPVPGVDLGLEWSMSSMLKKMQGLDQFYVRGDGTTAHTNLL